MRPPVKKDVGWTEFWYDIIQNNEHRGSGLRNISEKDIFESK